MKPPELLKVVGDTLANVPPGALARRHLEENPT